MSGEQAKYQVCPLCRRRVATKIVSNVRVFKSHLPERGAAKGVFCRGSGQPVTERVWRL